MGKSAPSAPAAPNPATVAQAQGTANTNTAIAQALLNQVNQSGPTGTLSYQQTGTQYLGPNGVTQGPTGNTWTNPATGGQYQKVNGTWEDMAGNIAPPGTVPGTDGTALPITTQTFTPSPAEAAIQQGQLKVGGELTNLADTATQTAQGVLSTPFQLPSAPSIVSGVNSTIPLSTMVGATGPTYGSVSGVPQVPIDPSQFKAQGDAAANAAFNASYTFLKPIQDQQTQLLSDQLRSQGLDPGSEGWDNAMTQLQNSQNSALTGLANQSVQTGYENQIAQQTLALQGQGQQFGQSLSNAQLANALQSQLFGEGTTNANLTNAAQGQQFNELTNNAQLNNAAREQSIQDLLTQTNEPLQQIAALLGTGNIQVPTGNTSPALTTIAPIDVTGAYGLNTQANQANYAAQLGLSSENNAGMAGLLGNAGLAAALFFG